MNRRATNLPIILNLCQQRFDLTDPGGIGEIVPDADRSTEESIMTQKPDNPASGPDSKPDREQISDQSEEMESIAGEEDPGAAAEWIHDNPPPDDSDNQR